MVGPMLLSLGSINADFQIRIDRPPDTGETLIGLFRQSLRPDAEPCNSSTSEEGLHLSAMAGSIDVIQRHYLGLGFEMDAIRLDPARAPKLGPVTIAFVYRQHNFSLRIGAKNRREPKQSRERHNPLSPTIRNPRTGNRARLHGVLYLKRDIIDTDIEYIR